MESGDVEWIRSGIIKPLVILKLETTKVSTFERLQGTCILIQRPGGIIIMIHKTRS